jgi:hypothetical protein
LLNSAALGQSRLSRCKKDWETFASRRSAGFTPISGLARTCLSARGINAFLAADHQARQLMAGDKPGHGSEEIILATYFLTYL